ncbi:hypothetical protein [Dyadobacter aurulentus]|uniref:hypothetical protein n=1 Tax=Dyadobacter sp. UC 10 TaxID=2605428 RepID=UPI001CEDFDC5|nr:hypothetical protein [Dyadobacter sp. UC 10]
MINVKGFCQAQIQVTLPNTPGPVAPGGHFTLFFTVKAETGLPDTLSESLRLPEKWQLLSQRKPERAAGQTTLRYFFVVGTPENTASGDYQVALDIKSGKTSFSTPVTVTVSQVRKMEIFVVSQPEFVREGDTLRVTYLVQNSGNNPEKFALKTTHGKIEEGSDSLTMQPNEKRKVTVTQAIPVTDNNAWQGTSDLSLELGGTFPAVHEAVSIPVFSSRIKKTDPLFRFPVEIGGGYMSYRYGGRAVNAFQYNVTGKGYLNEKNTHYLDFTLRGPNQFIFPAASSYDQYSVEYQYKKTFSFVAGDYILQLNNLMEFGRFGRGAKVEQEFPKVGYTVFYQKARFYPNQKEAAGGKVYFKFGQSSQIGINYQSKYVIHHNQDFWSHMVGLSSNIRTNTIQVETEIAGGKSGSLLDFGAYNRLTVNRKWLNFTSTLIYAGKEFYGFYNNSLLLYNNIGFAITPKLSIGLTSNFSNINPSLDANFYSISPKDNSYSAFSAYQPNRRTRLFLYYSVQQRQDRQAPASFNYTEDFGNVSYNFSGEHFTMFYQGRYGHTKNHLVADNSGKKQSFSNILQPAVRLRPWLWIGSYFEHMHTSKFSAADVVEDLFYYGGNARVNVKRNLYATFMYRNNYAPDELYVRRSYLDLSCALDLRRHLFTVAGGRSYVPNVRNQDQNTLFFTVKYALRLNVPLGKKKNIGRVHGRVTGSGFSKQGNLIRLGSHQFLTDSTGRFYFEGIAPDQYYLSITQNESKNDGVVPALKMPMFLNVKADSVRIVDIPLTRTGSIVGKIDYIQPSKAGLSTLLSEKPVVLIKISNETTSLLTEPNEEGAFSFREIKPGNWKVSAFIPGDQDRFVIDDHSISLDLATDQTMEIVFKVRPNEKRIHFSGKSFDLLIKK